MNIMQVSYVCVYVSAQITQLLSLEGKAVNGILGHRWSKGPHQLFKVFSKFQKLT